MKKKISIALAAFAFALLLVVGSVAGTIAYLTSTPGAVTNTFTVGNVTITLDEAKADKYGVADTSVARVTGNEYKLIPSHTYDKDPTVHVAAESEACWVFVKVENGISTIEAAETNATKKIATQIANKGWTPLDTVDNVFYRAVTAGEATTGIDLVVFEDFTISGTADVAAYKDAKIIVTAYAIQADGLTDAATAWTAGRFH